MELRCAAPTGHGGRACGAGIGEIALSLDHEAQIVGVVRFWNDRLAVVSDAGQRDARRCPRCGWYNLYLVQNGSRPPVGRRARIPSNLDSLSEPR